MDKEGLGHPPLGQLTLGQLPWGKLLLGNTAPRTTTPGQLPLDNYHTLKLCYDLYLLCQEYVSVSRLNQPQNMTLRGNAYKILNHSDRLSIILNIGFTSSYQLTFVHVIKKIVYS